MTDYSALSRRVGDAGGADREPGPTIPETTAFVRHLFNGVTDKCGQPYAAHCERVMAMLPVSATEDERHAALLHDVIEDTEVTYAELRSRGYSQRTIDLVHGLTRRPTEGSCSYLDYVRGIVASGDRGLIAIKLADNTDNLDPGRVALLRNELGLVSRYEQARRILLSALSESPQP